VEGQILLSSGETCTATRGAVEEALSSGGPFWLDMAAVDEEAAGVLEAMGVHPLSIEDAEHFEQRPKLETFDDYVQLVVHGANREADPLELHALYSEHWLVTVHREPVAVCDAVRERAALIHRQEGGQMVFLLYRIVDGLVDSFFPVLSNCDEEIDKLEDEILVRPTDEQLGQLFDMKQKLVAMRKVVTPERDVFAAVAAGVSELPGMTPEAERYFRDVYDHLIRISDLVDSYRDLLNGAVDTHLSVVSNRLNVVMKQLTMIATIFLPLSFLTGFFGQNFAYLVGHITGPATFFGAGIGLEALAVAALVWVFKKRNWF
jgi:magnesium transporter